MLDTLLLVPSLHCNTSLPFTTLHQTTLHYTYIANICRLRNGVIPYGLTYLPTNYDNSSSWSDHRQIRPRTPVQKSLASLKRKPGHFLLPAWRTCQQSTEQRLLQMPSSTSCCRDLQQRRTAVVAAFVFVSLDLLPRTSMFLHPQEPAER